MNNNAVSFQKVTKLYFTGKRYQPTFREWTDAILTGKSFYRPKAQLKALNQISFTVKQGSVIGIIGSNGAGKSTVLKLIAKITYPNEGLIETQGTVAGLLELWTGFHEELTGSENVYIYASILGLNRKKIAAIYKEIVKFAGIEDFMDTPVKHYSSGMYARLGFAVAVHVRPNILLIDEVLAVGDLAFKEKCLSFMKDYCRHPHHTVVFVSHSLENVKAVCTEVMWIEKGKIIMHGHPAQVIKAYERDQKNTPS